MTAAKPFARVEEVQETEYPYILVLWDSPKSVMKGRSKAYLEAIASILNQAHTAALSAERREALEEAAKIAEANDLCMNNGRACGKEIADEIRAKEK